MKKHISMSDKIKKAIGKNKLSMIEILDKVTGYTYRADYSKKVTEMANNGEIVRTWDDTGLPYYNNL